VQDIALQLFADDGFDATTVDQIATRAGISVATFFRYFATKADAAFNDPDEWLPEVWRAIVEHDPDVADLEAARLALQEHWVGRIDRDRAVLQSRAIASSPLLRGLSAEVGLRWRSVIADALARRRREPVADAEGELAAGLVLTVVGAASDRWITGPDVDLGRALDEELERVATLVAAWSSPVRRQRVHRRA